MAEFIPTPEQVTILAHDPDRHGRVMSAPGSGKTELVIQYVLHLMRDLGYTRRDIQVLTFNKNARKQIQWRLAQAGIPRKAMPNVDNYHSYSYWLFKARAGRAPNLTNSGTQWFWINKAISECERENLIQPDSVDAEDAMMAIRAWKSAVIRPENAGHRWNPSVAHVYARYEAFRAAEKKHDFDDIIGLACYWLDEREPDAKPKIVVVDEFQDMAYSYMKLTQLIAGTWASVLAFGDDDQNLYEWNGTRAEYVLNFSQYFTGRPHSEYTMTRSFRFGPVIAQAAHNVIRHNIVRTEKSVISADVTKVGSIDLVDDENQLVQEIVNLVDGGEHPSDIRVLVRTYTQLAGLEARMLERSIPYEIRGKQSFFKRKSCVVLLDYIRLSLRLSDPVNGVITKLLLNVINKPSRMIKRTIVKSVMSAAQAGELTLDWALDELGSNKEWRLHDAQRANVRQLRTLLVMLRSMQDDPAHVILEYLVDRTRYMEHFSDYYGHGFESFDRQLSVVNFIRYADSLRLSGLGYLKHIEELDTTQGAPQGNYIVMTTGYQEKGCEYDTVIIPQCVEKLMPVLRTDVSPIFDLSGEVDEPKPSPGLESERRLFYVALTRAKKRVIIGVPSKKDQASMSRFIEEMQVGPTRDVMDSLRKFAGAKDLGRKVVDAFKRIGNFRHITANVLAHYLPDLQAEHLAEDLTKELSTLPVKEFRYKHIYEEVERKQGNIHSSWGRIKR